MSAATTAVSPPQGSWLDRALRPFAEVRAGEGLTAILLMLDVFLILTAYYIIKTVREPLILAGGGAEVKSYTAAGQALLLLFLVPAYGAFASRVDRMRLIGGVTVFFASNLVIFYLLAQMKVPYLGVAFFLWVGIFSLMMIAQFWSFANDVYSPEQGKRLFAIVAFGATGGAIFGAWIAKPLIGAVGVYPMMPLAAGILLLCLALTRLVHAREMSRPETQPEAAAAGTASEPLARTGGYQLVFGSRYLLLIAVLMLVLNFVNTNGEYILGKTVTNEAAKRVAAGAAGAMDPEEWTRRFIGGFYGDFFGWVNTVGALVQLFLVSRIMKSLGVRVALFFMPIIAFGGYAVLATAPILGLVRIAKIAENSTDYSLQNTARQALFLPTSREAKYKAKAAIDSLFVRGGDLLSTAAVFLGAQISLGPQAFARINLALVVVWLVVVAMLGREYAKIERGEVKA
jgi:AAA family ATP:ADP antiporter